VLRAGFPIVFGSGAKNFAESIAKKNGRKLKIWGWGWICTKGEQY